MEKLVTCKFSINSFFYVMEKPSISKFYQFNKRKKRNKIVPVYKYVLLTIMADRF